MATKILVRRGNKADLTQSTLDEGELGFNKDLTLSSHELGLYVGSDAVQDGYIKVNSTKNIEYEGNALTSATDTNNLEEAIENIDVALKVEQDNVDTAQEDINELQSNVNTLTTNLNNHTHTMEELSNVVVSSASNGEVLKYLNGNWVNQADSVESDNFYLTSVDASNISSVSFVQDGVATDVTADFSHGHTISDVLNLQQNLNTKSDTGHTHLKADITDFAHTHLKADITDFAHTHTESDITDLDKYTQAEADALLETKVNQTTYDNHTHRTARYFLGSVSSEDLPNAVNYTMTVNIFNNSILLYSTQNPNQSNAAANLGTLWLNIQSGNVYRLENIISVSPPNYTWTQVGSVNGWPSITAIDADTYYGFNGTYWALQTGANPSQGTFLNVPNINALQTTIDNDQGLYIIKYNYYDSVADTTIVQTFVTHPTFIGWEDINDVYNIPAYNSGFVTISSQFLTGGVYNIVFPTPANGNDIQQIYFYGISNVSVTETQYVF